MNSPEHSLAGGWLGTYAYGGSSSRRPPVRFEATWTAHGDEGRFTGPVLDDGPLGEAQTDGMQTGRQVAFTKVYVNQSSSITHPIAYEGTLSEDGTQITGTWRLSTLSGTWDAHRLWSHEANNEHVEARTEAPSASELTAAP